MQPFNQATLEPGYALHQVSVEEDTPHRILQPGRQFSKPFLVVHADVSSEGIAVTVLFLL